MGLRAFAMGTILLCAPLACDHDRDDSSDASTSDAAPARDAQGTDGRAVHDAGSLPDATTVPDAGPDVDAAAVLDGSADGGGASGAGAGLDSATGSIDAGTPLVSASPGVVDEGRTCLRIESPVATYLYDEHGAGFTSIIDRDGHDWIGWRPGGGASGEFRGIPNMGRCCHPGYDGATTRILVEQPALVRIESTGTTTGVTWRVTWDFTPEHATLTVHDAPGPYYLLYEGTPGGSLGSEDYFVTSEGIGTMTYIDTDEELITADMPDPEWIYFADDMLGSGLLLVHHEDDDIGERYWTMDRSMTVFGFGRTAMGGATGLTATPQRMSIALIDGIDFTKASAKAGALRR